MHIKLYVAGDLIVRSEVIRYLGVWLNSTLNFKTHVTKECKMALLNFLRIRCIHHLLTEDATSSLVLSLCVSHLDYCNSVLYGLPDITIGKMQKIQNMCACLVLRKQMGQYNCLPCNYTLATSKAAYNFQDMCAYI